MTDQPQPYDCGACESPVACLLADKCKGAPMTTQPPAPQDGFEGHTPGPWIVENVGGGYGQFAIMPWGARERDALLANGVSIDALRERNANRALIARAPDLLAENARLRLALKRIDDWASDDGDAFVCEIARAALNPPGGQG